MKKILIIFCFLFLHHQIINSSNILGIKDASGEMLYLKKPPQRVISLAPSITENIYLLGVGEKMVGNTTYCDAPEDAKRKEKIGTYVQPNLEKIISLSPDVVLIMKEGMRKEIVYKMRSLGLQVFVFDQEESYKSVRENFQILGKIFSKEEEAEKILKYCEERINKIKKEVKNKKKVFYQLGVNPIITASGKTLSSEIIEYAGGINIAQKSKIKYPKYSIEEIIKQNPDIIIIVDMGIITEDATKKWKEYKNLNAAKNNKIYSIDANTMCRATPERFADAVELVYKILHK